MGLKKYFGASSCGKWRQLSADVHCVALGLKPAYLLDTLQPDPSRFCSLLNHVLSAGAVSDDELQQRKGVKWWRELRIVSVESDVLLVNWTAIQDLFQNCLFSRVYVNIGRSGSPPDSAVDRTDAHISIECSPGIEEKCQQWYSELSATEHTETDPISPSSDGRGIALKCLSVALPPDLNVCTLFGRLLGYPVVYWFPPAGQYSLDMVELVNYRVAVSSTSHSLGTPTPHTMKVCVH